jgi:hypothetical protein
MKSGTSKAKARGSGSQEETHNWKGHHRNNLLSEAEAEEGAEDLGVDEGGWRGEGWARLVFE